MRTDLNEDICRIAIARLLHVLDQVAHSVVEAHLEEVRLRYKLREINEDRYVLGTPGSESSMLVQSLKTS